MGLEMAKPDEVDLNTMSEEVKRHYLERRKRGNRAIVGRLRAQGIVVENVVNERLDFFVAFLVQQGIITDDQQLNFEILFEIHFNEVLHTMVEQIREKQAEAATEAAKPKLAVPNAPGKLILPGK